MKRVLLLILPILVIITAGFTTLGVIQVRSVRERLMDDLMRKARAVAESTEFSARDILGRADSTEAARLVESFQRREQMQGCILYDRNLDVIAATERIAGFNEPSKAHLKPPR